MCIHIIFSTLYTTLHRNLINNKLIELIEQTFKREGSFYLACNEKHYFFTSEQTKRYTCTLQICQKVCDVLHYLIDNIFIRFCSKLYRKIVGIPTGSYCVSLVYRFVIDLFFYERDFVLSLCDNYQAGVIKTFKSTSRYLNHLLNIDCPYFEE